MPATPEQKTQRRHAPVVSSTSASVMDAINILAYTAAVIDEDFNKFNSKRPHNQSDEEAQSLSPISDALVEIGGKDAIISTTNFSISGFNGIWEKVFDLVSTNWGVGRGWPSTYKSMEVLFMTLATLKHGGTSLI